MCRRARGTPVLALAALVVGLGVAAPAAGQDRSTERRAELERELVERLEGMRGDLERARERARREQQVRDSIRRVRSARNVDTLSVGPLPVVALPEQADDARMVFQDVWSGMAPWVGDAVDLTRTYYLYDPRRDVGAVHLSSYYRVSGRDWSVFPVPSFRTDVLEQDIRFSITREVAKQAPSALGPWTLGHGPYRASDEDLPRLYRRLVLTPSIAAEACVDGDIPGCWAAVGLNVSDDPVAEWYTEAQGSLSQSGSRSWFGCLDAYGREGCTDHLSDVRWWTRAIPLDRSLRADLLGFALERGGEGALGRLLGHLPPAEPGDAQDSELSQRAFAQGMRAGLVAASGMDDDALMGAWRERLVAARPDVQEESGRTRTATFLWILLFTVFATRSTRWRLG